MSYIHTSTLEISKAIDRSFKDEYFPVANTASEEDVYFKMNPKPDYLDELVDVARQFIELQHSLGRDRIVLVTSGGTTVPLENNTVRFIDNFSAGTRGASSAEQFLLNGYSVIFLHREFSLTPFNRKFTHDRTHMFLDYFTLDGTIAPEFLESFTENKKLYDKFHRDEKRLLLLPFTTVNQYLWSLKAIGQLMNYKGCLFYLAAAVSDFFVPISKLPQHKIQSRDYGLSGKDGNDAGDNGNEVKGNTMTTADGKLIVNLDPVPKFLSRLVQSWANKAMIVSFKLETDPSILMEKARYALKRYNHQLVIGNLLQKRSTEVTFVTPNKTNGYPIKLNDSSDDNNNKENICIEELIVPEVIKLHEEWMESSLSKGGSTNDQ